MKNIKHPGAARRKGIVGTSLSSFKITPAGITAEVTILNPLGEVIGK
jgi:hypothetical protein